MISTENILTILKNADIQNFGDPEDIYLEDININTYLGFVFLAVSKATIVSKSGYQPLTFPPKFDKRVAIHRFCTHYNIKNPFWMGVGFKRKQMDE